MKVVLTQALHARPASLLVRLATRHGAEVELRKGTLRANARNILDVLALGAVRGEEIDVEARGDDAEDALRAIAELVSQGFSPDLVPETGSAVVEGIAVGRAVVAMSDDEKAGERRSTGEEVARARAALAAADAELAQLVAALPENEAALFEPERAIVRDAAARIEAGIAQGASAEEAVRSVLGGTTTDLIADAQARLLDLIAGSDGTTIGKIRDAHPGDLVLVTDRFTPSLVASLPARVRAIVVAQAAGFSGLRTSHAAILARSRGVPLAIMPPHVASAMADGDEVMVDTTASPARVWVGPSPQLVRSGRAQQEAMVRSPGADRHIVEELASRLGVRLCVNVGALQERVPSDAQGVGLLRTELLFAARSSPPSEDEQYASLVAVARNAHGNVVNVRLFDAGGDKPLPWLPAAAEERGMALLFAHPDVLASQVRAIVRAAEREAVRILLPMCRSAFDLRSIRALASSLEVGAMIETPEAARDAAAIALAADFVCIGTNDLTAGLRATSRPQAVGAVEPRVLAVVDEIVGAAHAHKRPVTVCGEMAADPRCARILIGLGVDALSVATPLFAEVVRSLSSDTRDGCRAAAVAALCETETS